MTTSNAHPLPMYIVTIDRSYYPSVEGPFETLDEAQEIYDLRRQEIFDEDGHETARIYLSIVLSTEEGRAYY